MRSLIDILPELIELAVFSLGSVALSVAGLFIEQFALASAQGGQTVLAGWATVIGGVALLSAYFLATDKAASSFRTLRGDSVTTTE
jgi:Na+-translocating ferredoxin:NAD+ oxidoreductase RnfD subunit